MSKRVAADERKAAWRELGNNKERVVELLSECSIRFMILRAVHGRFVKSAEATLARCAQMRVNRAKEAGVDGEGSARREAIADLLRWRETPTSLATRHKRCLAHYEGMHATMKTLSQHNLRLVVKVARRYDRLCGGKGSLVMPLISAGSEGLLSAVEKFDYNRGCRFSTHATWWIKQAITKEVPKLLQLIHVPPAQVTALRGLKKTARVKGSDKHNAAEDADSKLLYKAGRALNAIASLDAPAPGVRESARQRSLGELIPSRGEGIEKDAYRRELVALVREGMAEVLTYREREILQMRMYEGMTLEDCGKEFSVTRERIRQIEAKAKRKLEPYLKERLQQTLGSDVQRDLGLLELE